MFLKFVKLLRDDICSINELKAAGLCLDDQYIVFIESKIIKLSRVVLKFSGGTVELREYVDFGLEREGEIPIATFSLADPEVRLKINEAIDKQVKLLGSRCLDASINEPPV